MRVWRIVFLLAVLGSASVLLGATLGDHLARFDRLVKAKDWPAAESVARQAVAAYPQSRDARLALANVLLWQKEFRAAVPHYRQLIAGNPLDREARLGLANAYYWSGDFRAARREYALLPGNPDAARALREIEAASAPGFRFAIGHRSDDQPLRATQAVAEGFIFSDPLTSWEASAGTTTFAAAAIDADAPFVRVGAKSMLPRIATTLRGSVTLLRFPDGETAPLGLFEAARRIGTSHLSLTASRRELFGSAPSLHTHAWVDSIEMRWLRENASIRAETLRYFDDNRGIAADAWLLIPMGALSIGGSVAYRDTDESRFAATGVYDPYWTPLELREARLIFTFTGPVGRMTAGFHIDAGAAQERQNGDYHPWRAKLTFAAPLRTATIHVEAERLSTVFYTANEIRASLAGRF